MNIFQRAMKRVMNSDAWENVVTLLGTSYDKSTYHRVYPEIWYDCEELEDLYYSDSYARKIVEEIVDSAFRQGFNLTNAASVDPDMLAADKVEIFNLLDEFDVVSKYRFASYWGRLYGRGGLLLGVDDGRALWEPLEIERVKGFKYLEVLDYFDFQCMQKYSDVESGSFGLPELWLVTRGPAQIVVHESRILLTRGAPTSRRKREENDWRDASVLQGPYRYLRNWDMANQGAAHMLTDSSQAVLKIKDFSQMLATEDIAVFSNRMRVLEMGRSLRIMPVDAENEDFLYVERTFSGVGDLLDRAATTLAGAASMPQTVLFGRSPAGMNATGESDTRGWYDGVNAERADEYQPGFELLVRLCAYIVGAMSPDSYGVQWASLWQETEDERASTDKKYADLDKAYLDMGVITEDEIAETRFGGDEFSRALIQIDFEGRAALKEMDRAQLTEGIPEPEPEIEEEAEIS